MFEHLPINPLNETDDSFAPSVQLQGCRVVKVGGSILFPLDRIGQERKSDRHLCQVRTRLQTWNLNNPALPNQATVWITGTGELGEVFRKAERSRRLSASTAHWTSIEYMDTSAEVLGSQFPGWPITTSLAAPPNCRNIVLAVHRWLLHAAAKRIPPVLPESAEVTSDSIAAWVAIQLRADELVLLKSCAIPSDEVRVLSKRGIVDSHLATVATYLKSQLVALKFDQI